MAGTGRKAHYVPIMSAILYPVAADAEAALAGPLGRAARERDAAAVAGGPVTFVSEAAGAAFADFAEASTAFAALTDVPPEDRFCRLREEVDGARGRWPMLTPVQPTHTDGRRWPAQVGGKLPTRWRLSVSYWRVQKADEIAAQAREARRKAGSEAIGGDHLRAMGRQPLRPIRPQQPLDIGLFEVRPPEAPDTLIPDE